LEKKGYLNRIEKQIKNIFIIAVVVSYYFYPIFIIILVHNIAQQLTFQE
jgi:hypothetical protein